ncbi:DUF1801 domain-containing protein [Candidatus Dojkabacteria bacterium]|uniref:DUF1801 domain-containing protein n=1 Tax=Candidatus Dojkabacteria bacterium TaxID=2099670 RepID=A0A955I9A0_9BACT|nr:DUF1801 domain-containing protein [Candidatus Dojkabacteria bacterium]
MNTSNQTFKSIDEYISKQPKEIQPTLEKIRKTILKVNPDFEEDIRYGMPTFRLKDKNIVHFAAFANHIGFYPTPSGLDEFEQDLKPYRSGKGTAQFKIDEPIPFDLIEKITKFRVNEVL